MNIDEKRLLKNEYMRNYRLKNSNYIKKYRKENQFKYKEKENEYKKNWYQRNKEEIKQKRKKYYSNNKEKILKTQKNYYIKNKEKRKKYIKEYNVSRRKTDAGFKILGALRSRIASLITNKKFKNDSSLELTGCSIDELKKHLSSKFKDGMCWDNYGKNGWHIDHIMPCSSFDLTDKDKQKQCFHYSNLQPLWWWENLSKGNKKSP